jgi:hypothetical protein
VQNQLQMRTHRVAAASPRWLAGGCALVAIVLAPVVHAAEIRLWESSPYRVLATLAVDDAVRPFPGLEAALAKSIVDRVEGSLRPLWNTEFNIAASGADRRQCFHPAEIPVDDLSGAQSASDKLLWLGVRATPSGFELTCREFDVYVRRWSPVRRRFVQQAAFLPEACFGLLTSTFSPLALVTPIEGDDVQVQLSFKGSRLPRPSGEETFVAPGEALLPLLRRTDRAGKLVEGGVTALPWTLLTAAEPNDDGWLATVHSGIRRPFAMARRGLVEQLAIALRNPQGPTRIRFHSRTDETQGLAGYEVFRSGPDGANDRIGVTDRDGVIEVPPVGDSVSMLILRSDGQVLAKVPMPVGADEVLQAPIADNVARLQAQAEAQVVREELIDLVARRAIMMGRVKSLLKNERVADAAALMDDLAAMPSPSVFSRTIDNAARRTPPSNDPSVQKRIDALYAATRDMLAKFLSTRPITDLQNEVNAAANPAPPAADAAEPPADAAPPS